jgi:hypothetical protein
MAGHVAARVTIEGVAGKKKMVAAVKVSSPPLLLSDMLPPASP